MKPSKIASLLALLFAFALVAAACGSDDPVASSDDSVETDGTATDDDGAATDDGEPADDSAATDDGEMSEDFTVSQGIVEPSFIDSFNIQDSEGFEVGRLIFDGLTDFDSDLKAIPAVAESWDHEDFTVWTFNLKPGTTFHNGETVTAQSFINAFTYLASPDAASDVSYYGDVAGIEGFGDVASGDATEISGLSAPDDNTLVITLSSSNALLPSIIAHPAFSPRSEAAMADPAASLETPIGNGPYKMVGPWEHNVSISLERFEDYYGTPGNPSAVDFLIFDSLDTMYLEVQAGTLDITDVPAEQIEAAAAEFGDRNIEVSIGAYNYLGFPVNTAPYDNADLRKALSMAIDREAITQQIFAGTRDPADGFYPGLAPGGSAGLCTNCVYDVEAAKTLFESAGGIPGDKVTVYFNSGSGHEDWIQAVANNWNQAFGIEAEFIGQEFAPYLDFVQGGEIDGPFRLGWGWDYPHAVGFLEPLFKTGSTDNLSGFSNADFDAALAEFRALEDPVSPEAEALIVQMSEVLNEEMPVMPMFFSRGQIVHTDRITNVNLTAFDYVEMEKITLK
ncbi:MAG: ABC transporter substrate-binding protein [Acidimicrobiales bacterium]|nr:ABC transporter substrate-binding protein [Acidimicrobiales bacterium]